MNMEYGGMVVTRKNLNDFESTSVSYCPLKNSHGKAAPVFLPSGKAAGALI
jgi:hypothetical protein